MRMSSPLDHEPSSPESGEEDLDPHLAPAQAQDAFIDPSLLEEGDEGAPGDPPRSPLSAQKRRRVTRACDECRRKKIKCDGKQPCAHCTVYSYGDALRKPPGTARRSQHLTSSGRLHIRSALQPETQSRSPALHRGASESTAAGRSHHQSSAARCRPRPIRTRRPPPASDRRSGGRSADCAQTPGDGC